MLLFSQWKSKSIRLDSDYTCFYIERGCVDTTEASILFVHGYGESAVTNFWTFPRYFERKYHLVAIDLLNHGNSTCVKQKIDTWTLVDFIKKVCMF